MAGSAANITLYKNDGTNTSINININLGQYCLPEINNIATENVGASNEDWSREGYNFIEWNTQANGSGTSYQPGDIFDEWDDFYAIWEAAITYKFYNESDIQAIASAIRSKNGTQNTYTVSQMSAAIASIETGGGPVVNSALVLMDWEGTILKEYSASEVATLTALPVPSALPAYSGVDHELLSFQSWNWSLVDIKTWVTNHPGKKLTVGAIYTTTDNQDHNYWRNTRLASTTKAIYMQKRKTTSIGSNAFNSCYSLTSINIPNSVTSIGNNTFQNCSFLTSINIPDGVTSIGNNTFNRCYSLTSINIPNSVTSIDNQAFSSCYSLTSINIPDSVTSIGSNAFGSCSSLTSINISDSVTSISNYAFAQCPSLTSINIPDDVTSIGAYAFYYCYSLTSINIPDGVTSIGSNAFNSCSSLTSINIPNSVTSIGDQAFQNCRSLTSINIPNSVTSIGSNAFYSCPFLVDCVIRSKPSLSASDAFSSTHTNLRFYVPRANLSWFETATNWSTFYSKFVAIEDYISYLTSIGIDVSDYA